MSETSTTDTDPVDDTGDTAELSPDLTWVEAHVGGWWSCGLVSDGTVRCWGEPSCASQAPNGDPEYGGPTFTKLSVGAYVACGIREGDSTLGCWCCPDYGAYEMCDDVPAGEFVDIDVGDAYACATDREGLLTCWGAYPGWLQLPVPTGEVVDVDVENHLGCAVMLDGTIRCFGAGITWAEPVPAGVSFVDVALARNAACGREADGTVRCWGRVDIGIPFPDPPAGSFTTLEAYRASACVLDPSGNPQCWGATSPGTDPVPQERFGQISVGEAAACGVTLDGDALCWGSDSGLGETMVPRLGR